MNLRLMNVQGTVGAVSAVSMYDKLFAEDIFTH